ncbi:MAG: hypothetical protein ABJE47_00030 [bacterium]
MRDSIVYRFDAMLYHCNMIDEVRERYQSHFEVVDPPRDEYRSLIRRASTQQLFLFDDIVFASSSLFDYLGSYVATVLHGPKQRYSKWKGANRLARDGEYALRETGSRAIADSGAGLRIVRANREWIDSLNDYRADLIHRRAEKPDGQLSHNLLAERDAFTLTAFAPESFATRMRVPVGDALKLPLDAAMHWLVMRTFGTVVDISLSLLSDVRHLPHPLTTRPFGNLWLPRYT